jgi:hypothetical protein
MEPDNANSAACVKKCFACGEVAEHNVEHLIPDGLGGRLTGRVVCEQCNQRAGASVDRTVVETLLPLAIAHGALTGDAADRRFRLMAIASGFHYTAAQGKVGLAHTHVWTDPDGTQRAVVADEEGVRALIAKWKRRRGIPEEAIQHSAGSEQPTVTLPLVVDAQPFSRWAIKCGLELLALHPDYADGLPSDCFDAARRFAFFGDGDPLAFFNYDSTDFLSSLSEDQGQSAHAVAIHFDSEGGNVVAYGQLFGGFRFSGLLAKHSPWGGRGRSDLAYWENPTTGQHGWASPTTVGDTTDEDAIHRYHPPAAMYGHWLKAYAPAFPMLGLRLDAAGIIEGYARNEILDAAEYVARQNRDARPACAATTDDEIAQFWEGIRLELGRRYP